MMKQPYPFLIREKHLKASMHFFDESNQGTLLLLNGDSGTGKTFFAKELLFNYIKKFNDTFSLYIDIANDIHESEQTISYILSLVLLQSKPTREWPVNIPKNLTFDTYQNKKNINNKMKIGASSFVSVALHYFGLGKLKIFNSSDKVESIPKEIELELYLKWVTSHSSIIIAIDNVQFLNYKNRNILINIFERINYKIKLIIIDRTENGNSLIYPPLNCFLDNNKNISFDKFNAEETLIIVNAMLPNENNVKTIAQDIYVKSNGLAKDIEYCINGYIIEKNKGLSDSNNINGLLSSIDKLPLMHRQFLLIAALLNGGLKKSYTLNVIKRIYRTKDLAEISKTLDELIDREYLKINSITKDRVLPAHERIVNVMQELVNSDIHEEVRVSLLEEFEDILNNAYFNDNDTYLLYCFIGLQTSQELVKNLTYISRLITSKYRQDSFNFIVIFVQEMEDLIFLLPEETIFLVLDAYQKNSSFEQGLNFIEQLKIHTNIEKNQLNIYKFKFLIQSYHYQDAINLANVIDQNDWKNIYLLNIYQALDNKDKSLQIFQDTQSSNRTEEQAILLRNSVNLFDYQTAITNLKKAQSILEDISGSDFRLATIENNMGLIYLKNDKYGDALRMFEASIEKFLLISSNEVYQSYINIAIYYLVTNNLDLSLKYLEQAKHMVPISLLLDIVKIETNIAIIQFIKKDIKVQELEEKFQNLLHRIKGIDMPYLRAVLKANINTCNTDQQTINPIKDNVLVMNIRAQDRTWYVLMSIHWRY